MIQQPTKSTEVGIFFSYRVGLLEWKKLGILERELLAYRELIKENFTFKLFTWDSPGSLMDLRRQFPEFEIYSLKLVSGLRYLDILQGLISILLLNRPLRNCQVFKSYQMMGAWIAAIASMLYRKKYVLRVGYELLAWRIRAAGPSFKTNIIYWMSAWSYGRATQIVATSEAAKRFIRFTFTPSCPIEVQRNFIDTSMFVSTESAKRSDAIFVGRLDAHKRVNIIIKFCNQMNWDLTVVGDGPELQRLRAFAASSQNRVRFEGRVENSKLPQLLGEHKYIILMSKSEGYPKSLLEGMSCGLIPIGTNSSGIAEIVRSISPSLVVSGLGFTSRDLEKLRNILEKDAPDLAYRARQYVIDTCSLESFLASEMRLLRI